jgi:hypothetical protein
MHSVLSRPIYIIAQSGNIDNHIQHKYNIHIIKIAKELKQMRIQKPMTITIDENTKKIAESLAKKFNISVSAVIRLGIMTLSKKVKKAEHSNS